MRIGDICTADVACVGLNATVQRAAESMRQCHVGALVVVSDDSNDERRPVGIVTDRDIVLKAVADDVDAKSLTVATIMTTSVATCKETADPFEAIDIMRRHGVRRLPVLSDNGRLVGLVSADDIYAAIMDDLSALSQALLQERVRELRQGSTSSPP